MNQQSQYKRKVVYLVLVTRQVILQYLLRKELYVVSFLVRPRPMSSSTNRRLVTFSPLGGRSNIVAISRRVMVMEPKKIESIG